MKTHTQKIRVRRLPAAMAAALVLLLVAVPPALAHTRVETGPYVFIIGWEKEPVIVGERNAILLEITVDGEPVVGVEGVLDLTVFYGGRSYIGQLAPAEEEGVYLAEIFPTVRGQYELQIIGEIGGHVVDVLVEPEEVLPANILQFPESQPDPSAMQVEIDTLVTELSRARNLALSGIALGVIGLLAGGTAIWIASKGKQGTSNEKE